jgi:hypothetical protein
MTIAVHKARVTRRDATIDKWAEALKQREMEVARLKETLAKVEQGSIGTPTEPSTPTINVLTGTPSS